MKSGVTLITALVMLVGLGTRIAKVQWVAIILQVRGFADEIGVLFTHLGCRSAASWSRNIIQAPALRIH